MSLKTYSLTVSCFILWTIYGVMTSAWPVTFANACALAMGVGGSGYEMALSRREEERIGRVNAGQATSGKRRVETTASTGAVAGQLYGSGRHLDQLLDESKADAGTFTRAIVRPLRLSEQIEDAVLHVMQYAHAVVSDVDPHLVLDDMRGNTDLSFGRRVFGGVGQQVADHLGKAGEVALEP